MWIKSVRSIVTVGLTGTFCYLSAKGIIPVDNFMNVFLVVITFYFAAKSRTNGGNGQ
jgi:hypothetical protein